MHPNLTCMPASKYMHTLTHISARLTRFTSLSLFLVPILGLQRRLFDRERGAGLRSQRAGRVRPGSGGDNRPADSAVCGCRQLHCAVLLSQALVSGCMGTHEFEMSTLHCIPYSGQRGNEFGVPYRAGGVQTRNVYWTFINFCIHLTGICRLGAIRIIGVESIAVSLNIIERL